MISTQQLSRATALADPVQAFQMCFSEAHTKDGIRRYLIQRPSILGSWKTWCEKNRKEALQAFAKVEMPK